MDIKITLSADEIEKIIRAMDFYAHFQSEFLKQANQNNEGFKYTEKDFDIDGYMNIISKLSIVLNQSIN
jgi:hypothetical protein